MLIIHIIIYFVYIIIYYIEYYDIKSFTKYFHTGNLFYLRYNCISMTSITFEAKGGHVLRIHI